MTITEIWLVILAIATPTAGVFGFAIQLRNLRQARLESEKLALELQLLRQKMANSESRIVVASNEEVRQFTRQNRPPLFSLPDPDGESNERSAAPKRPLSQSLSELAVGATVIVLVAYFLYDLYRLTAWLLGGL